MEVPVEAPVEDPVEAPVENPVEADGVIIDNAVEESPELEEVADGEDMIGEEDDLDVKEKVSKQTIGANLNELADDQKSFAATEKQ